MPSRFRPSLSGLAAALALACAPALVVAQMSALPTSPGFKMDVNKGETGAPEPGPLAGHPAEPHAHAEPVAAAGKAAGHGEAAKVEPKADRKTDPKAESRPEAKAGQAAASASAPADPLEHLRQRLAEKLGAKPSTGGKFVMKVSNHGESGENVISSVRPSAAAIGGARRAAAVPAGVHVPPDDAHAAAALVPTHWDYAGIGGPDAWAKLDPANAACANGARQSPIDIRGGIAVDLEPIQFDYRPSGFSVVDNGHTVQVNVEPGNAITITGRRYDLVQFHFHRPSEERINGRQFDMVAHLVHKSVDGKLAVVAVLLDRGSAQPIVQTVWNNLPLEKGDEVHAGAPIDLAQLLPQDKRYYTYMGSLTTPPCSEGVLWMVMKQPVPISPEQVGIFSRLYPMNARPIQQASGRLIKESN